MDALTLEQHPAVIAYRRREAFGRLVRGHTADLLAASGAAAGDGVAHASARATAELRYADRKPTPEEQRLAIDGAVLLSEHARTGGVPPRSPLARLNRPED